MNGDIAVLDPRNIRKPKIIKTNTNGMSKSFLRFNTKPMNSFTKLIIYI